MGSLRLYSAAMKKAKWLICSIDDPSTALEQQLENIERAGISSCLEENKGLHARLFQSILTITTDICSQFMRPDVAQACLILLSVFVAKLDALKLEGSLGSQDDVSCEVFFLEGIIIRASLGDRAQWMQHLGDLDWNIRDEPWKAKTDTGGPVNFSHTLFEGDNTLYILIKGHERREAVPVPEHNPNVYNVLKSIHDFFIEHRDEWEANDKVLLRGITRRLPSFTKRDWNVFL